jgi:lycopene beta-cyclase
VEIVEPREAYVRDRTWCGWRFGEHPFASAVRHRWQRWAVQDGSRRIVRESARHPYECIPADAFYALAQDKLGPAQLRLGTRVTAIEDRGDHVLVETSRGPLRAAMVFDGRPEAPDEQLATGVDEVALLQHFAGWEITAPRPCFDPGVVEMMDFAVSQARGLHFMYMLPFSDREALVEATYISPAPLDAAQYEADIRGWIDRRYGLREYAIGFREAGRIPMSTRPARPRSSPRVIRIGLRGGLAKPSTGYAFAAIQEFSAELAARIVAQPGGPVEPPEARGAAAVAMDRVFLSYLDRHPGRGPALFADLFEKLPADLLCRFLTDHGSPLDGLRVMAATPLGQMTAEVLRSRARWLRRPAA